MRRQLREYLKRFYSELISSRYSHKRTLLYSGLILIVALLIGGNRLVSYISAFNDTTYTWVFNSTTDGDYVKNNSTVDNSGSYSSLTNSFSNPGFESGASGWNEWSEINLANTTLTPSLAKRNSAGPFAAGVLSQGTWANSQNDGGATNDRIDAPRGNQISGNFYENIDTNQLTIVFWITPEWNGNDGEYHGMLGVSGGNFRMWKTSGGSLSITYGGQSANTNISSWVAGSTYSVAIRIDSKATLNGTHYISISINDVHTFATTTQPTAPAPVSFLSIGTLGTAQFPSDAIIEGLTIYRRVLFDGTYGVDMGNGDEIAQIYNSGTGRDPTLITGSWDVVFALPTNGTAGALASGTGNAWSHPHSSNLLGGTNGSNGFMMAGNYESDGLEATGSLSPTSGSGGSLSFDGADDFVQVGMTGLNTYTYSFWVKANNSGDTDQVLISTTVGGSNNCHQITYRISTNAISYRGQGPTITSYTKNLNVWTHISVTNNTATDESRLYVDGVQVGSDLAKYCTQTLNNLYRIGRSAYDGHNLDYSGLIDDVRIYNRALTQQEINDTMYKKTLTSSEQSGLVVWWKMNDGSGQIVADSSGNSNSGTFGASTSVGTDDPTWSTVVPAPTVSTLANSEKLYSGGYKFTSSSVNQGIYRDVTVSAGNDWVVRGVAHSDGVCQPKLILYDQTNGAEIGSLTGTTTSTKNAPNNLLFTGEAPAGMTTLRVKLVNAAATASTCYWHQVELYSNLVNNPSVESGSGNPWIPTGWSGWNITTGESSQELSIVRTGNSSVRFNSGASTADLLLTNGTMPAGSFFSVGHFSYGNGTHGVNGMGNDTPFQYIGTGASAHITPASNSTGWSQVRAVVRGSANKGYVIYPNGTLTSSVYADDLYRMLLTPVSLTITPATTLNSTESTGVRVDGADTLTYPLTNLTADSGSISFSMTPRHSFSTVSQFGHSQPVIAYLYGNSGNWMRIRRESATQIRTLGMFNGVYFLSDWNNSTIPIELDAGVTYNFKISYQNGGSLTVSVNGVDVSSVNMSGTFSTVPNIIYLGSGNTGDTQYDATFSAPTTTSSSFTEESVGHRYGSKAIVVNATLRSHLINQTVNLGNTNTYKLTAYIKESSSATVDQSVAQIFVGNQAVTTSYQPVGDGWYLLSASFAGTASLRSYGILVKQGYTVIVDDITLKRDLVSYVYTANAYTTPMVQQWDIFEDSTTIVGDNAQVRYQVCNDDPSECESTGWLYWNGSAWAVVTDQEDSNTALELSSETTVGGVTQYPLQWLDATEKKFAVKAIFFEEGASTIKLLDASIGLTTDATPPEDVDPLAITLKRDVDGDTIPADGWTNQPDFHLSWPQVDDDIAGSGIKGYCLYLGQDQSVNPGDPNLVNSKGLLGNSPVEVIGTTCDFIVGPAAAIDFANISYRGVDWISSSAEPYFFNIVAVDNSGNISSQVASFEFNYDDVLPVPPQYVSLPSGYVSTKDVTMLWPTTGSSAAQDTLSGVDGLQYKIGTGGTWYGDTHSGTQDRSDLLVGDGSYTMDETYDYPLLDEGENFIYVRVWDNAGNVSTNYTNGAIKLNTLAPSEPQNLAVTPTESETNSYSFSWSAPNSYLGPENLITYCYSVNTLPSVNTCNWTGAGVTSLQADTYATQPGTNNFYVVARDEAGNVNFGTYAQVAFTYSGSAPGIPTSVEISDISIKASESWKLATSWAAPSDTGAGVQSYKIYRSSVEGATCSADLSQFEEVGVTSGTSYVDSALEQIEYSYCIKACDSANSCSASSSTVSMLPTGRYYEPAEIVVAPKVVQVSTRNATIEWVTARDSDSKVQFGLKSGEYFKDEIYRSDQSSEHSITLSNLDPGTEYFFRAKWTDGDGNTGLSSEYTFKTAPPPAVSNVVVSSIDIDSAIVEFTTVNSVKADLRYGFDLNYGGVRSVNTAYGESRYSIRIDGLNDGTEYHFGMALYDTEGYKYEIQEDNSFTTLPRPKVVNVKLQQAKDTASPTIVVTWESNTEISTSLTYYPEGNPGATFEIAKTELVKEHQIVVDGLSPATRYVLHVSGKDRKGNIATSEQYLFTTASDTRAPRIFDVEVNISELPVGYRSNSSQGAQITVTWKTDEPASSQVEYGEGSGDTYTMKSSENLSLTTDHVVVISGLEASKAYHLRVISMDGAGNISRSIDYVTITPKASAGSLDIVLKAVSDIFGR